MDITRKICFFTIRSILFLLGFVIFATALPHKDPWNMSYINVDPEGGIIEMTPFFNDGICIRLSISSIFVFIGIILIGLLICTPAARKAAQNCLQDLKFTLALVLSISLLLFTLAPTKDGYAIIVYLMFASTGLLFLIIALFPLVVWLREYSFVSNLRRLFDTSSTYIFEVNISYLLIGVFIVALILTNLASYYLFEHIPHVQDSLVQVFHAKIFSIGKITVPSHPIKEFFDFSHMINNGKWHSAYPPGHAIMIMIGLFIGMPWMINPLLGSLSILLLYFIGREMYDDKIGRISMSLGLFSPFILFMSSEFMSHSSALFFLLLFILFFVKTTKKNKLRYPLVSGSSLGMALIARPVTALAVSVPFAICALLCLIKSFNKNALRFFIMLISCSAFVGLLLTFNYLANGDPLLFSYEVKWGPKQNLGFGNGVWGEAHTPQKGLQQNLNNLNALNKYLFEWPIPSLVFVFIPFMLISKKKWDYVLISSFFSLSIVYFFFWYQDWCFGPRYMYEASGMAIILTARGVLLSDSLINNGFKLEISPAVIKRTVATLIFVCLLTGVIFNLPPLIRHYGSSYWRVNASVLKLVKQAGVKNAVVFVKSYYGSVLPLNSPFLDNDIIFARHMGKNNTLLMRYYPDRRYYLASNYSIIEVFD